MGARPWYAGGLRFACTRCGACCTGAPGHTWVTPDEIEALASHLGLSLDAFGRRYLRRVGDRYALLENARTGACVLLDGRRCSVYETRPRQCRAYPFWERNLASPERWRAEAAACEGIGGDAPLLSLGEIETQRAGSPAPAGSDSMPDRESPG